MSYHSTSEENDFKFTSSTSMFGCLTTSSINIKPFFSSVLYCIKTAFTFLNLLLFVFPLSISWISYWIVLSTQQLIFNLEGRLISLYHSPKIQDIKLILNCITQTIHIPHNGFQALLILSRSY